MCCYLCTAYWGRVGGVLRIAWAARTHLRTILVVKYCITLVRIVCLTGGGPKSGSCQAVSGSCCCCVQVLRAGAAVLHQGSCRTVWKDLDCVVVTAALQVAVFGCGLHLLRSAVLMGQLGLDALPSQRPACRLPVLLIRWVAMEQAATLTLRYLEGSSWGQLGAVMSSCEHDDSLLHTLGC